MPDDNGVAYLQNVLFLQAEAVSWALNGEGVGTADPTLLVGRGPSGPTIGGKKLGVFKDGADPLALQPDLTLLLTDLTSQLTLLRAIDASLRVSKPKIDLAADPDPSLTDSSSDEEKATAYLQTLRKLLDLGASLLLGSVETMENAQRRVLVAQMGAAQVVYGAELRARLKAKGLVALDDTDATTLSLPAAVVNGKAIVRTPASAAAFLTGTTSTGRFFPNGLNTLDRLP